MQDLGVKAVADGSRTLDPLLRATGLEGIRVSTALPAAAGGVKHDRWPPKAVGGGTEDVRVCPPSRSAAGATIDDGRLPIAEGAVTEDDRLPSAIAEGAVTEDERLPSAVGPVMEQARIFAALPRAAGGVTDEARIVWDDCVAAVVQRVDVDPVLTTRGLASARVLGAVIILTGSSI